jgi:hypothetical protein
MQQLTLPLVVGIEAMKEGLLSFVHQMGMAALNHLLAMDAGAIARPKGKRNADRTAYHCSRRVRRCRLAGDMSLSSGRAFARREAVRWRFRCSKHFAPAIHFLRT